MASGGSTKPKASASSTALTDYHWERLPDMTTPRCYVAAAYHEGKLYVMGGCDKDGKPINAAEAYSFADKQWTTLPPLPRNRAACKQAIVRDRKIYLVGGVTDNQLPLAEVDYFDIEKQKWDQIQPLPIRVVGPYVALIDDKIYSVGGTDKDFKKDNNQSVVYDFDQGTWLPLPAKPTPCYSCGGYLYDRKLYIVGGRHGSDPIQAVEAFDLDTQQWEVMAPMGTVRVFYNVVGIKDEIYVIGGVIPMVGVSKIVERYSIHEDMWSRVKDLSEPRSDSVEGVVGGRVVVVGGLGGGNGPPGMMDTGEAIRHQGKRFHPIPSLGKQRSSATSLCFDGKLAVVNGMGEGGVQAVVEVLCKK